MNQTERAELRRQAEIALSAQSAMGQMFVPTDFYLAATPFRINALLSECDALEAKVARLRKALTRFGSNEAFHTVGKPGADMFGEFLARMDFANATLSHDQPEHGESK